MATVWHATQCSFTTRHILLVGTKFFYFSSALKEKHVMQQKKLFLNKEIFILLKRKPISDPLLFLLLCEQICIPSTNKTWNWSATEQQQLLLPNCSLIVRVERNSNQSSSLFANSRDEHLVPGQIDPPQFRCSEWGRWILKAHNITPRSNLHETDRWIRRWG